MTIPFLLTLLLLSGQATSPDAAPALQQQANKYFQEEQARQKRGLCTKQDNNAALNGCLTDELVKTKANYVGFTRALGGLLRLNDDGQRPTTVRRIPFDDAETAWLSYREATCQSVYKTFAGGTMAAPAYGACVLSLTGNHMRELHDTFTAVLQS